MPLFNPADELNVGRWKLPLYKMPTPLGINLKQVPDQEHYNDMQLMIRIGSPSDLS